MLTHRAREHVFERRKAGPEVANLRVTLTGERGDSALILAGLVMFAVTVSGGDFITR